MYKHVNEHMQVIYISVSVKNNCIVVNLYIYDIVWYNNLT